MPEKFSKEKKVLILGAGYVGQALFAALSERTTVYVTSRKGRVHSSGHLAEPFCFDLRRPETWSLPIEPDFIIWTFPAAVEVDDIQHALSFCRRFIQKGVRVAVFASTSCYLTNAADQSVDEASDLDFSQPRVHAEEELRRLGCLILTLAGIYGPHRDPAQWLMRGLVKNGQSFINLIHISDIIKITQAWLDQPLQGIRLNVSDGRHRRWMELLEQLKVKGTIPKNLEPFVTLEPDLKSKRVENHALLSLLYGGPFHKYPEDGLT
jgi:nucleoside-diphosphate-sugar epimerase